jgi:hypothetical protein
MPVVRKDERPETPENRIQSAAIVGFMGLVFGGIVIFLFWGKEIRGAGPWVFLSIFVIFEFLLARFVWKRVHEWRNRLRR